MRFLVVLGLSFLLMMQGCAFWSVGLTLTAQKNDSPISFSEGILGYDNELILRDGYEVVHHFTMAKSVFTWNHWVSGVSYLKRDGGQPKRVDLSDEFEELVRSHNGAAIVNLKIKSEGGETFEYILSGLLTFGLIAPDSVNLTIEGDVIRLKTTTTTVSISEITTKTETGSRT